MHQAIRTGYQISWMPLRGVFLSLVTRVRSLPDRILSELNGTFSRPDAPWCSVRMLGRGVGRIFGG